MRRRCPDSFTELNKKLNSEKSTHRKANALAGHFKNLNESEQELIIKSLPLRIQARFAKTRNPFRVLASLVYTDTEYWNNLKYPYVTFKKILTERYPFYPLEYHPAQLFTHNNRILLTKKGFLQNKTTWLPDDPVPELQNDKINRKDIDSSRVKPKLTTSIVDISELLVTKFPMPRVNHTTVCRKLTREELNDLIITNPTRY